MHRLVLASLATQQLIGAIREHLVAIHVMRGAGPGLVRIDDEVLAMPAGEHLIGGFHDRVREFGVETAGLPMREGGGFLDLDDGVNEGGERSERGDREVLAGAFAPYAPQPIGSDWPLSQRVTLDARLIH